MDPIADALIRIKNGYMARKNDVPIAYSKLVSNLCDLLAKKGYIERVEKVGDREIKVILKYKDRLPVSEKISQEVLSLPVHPSVTKENLDYVIKTFEEIK